jgi:hypothetical protein
LCSLCRNYFQDSEIKDWKLATTAGQNIKELAEGEVFGYPVESGMGCFMDVDTQNSLNELEQKLYHKKGGDFMGIYEEFFHEYFLMKRSYRSICIFKAFRDSSGTIFAFETGYGEGFYASYIAYDKNQSPVKIITEFIEIS